MPRPLDVAFWVLVLAIVTMFVRPGSRAGQAVIAVADVLAAVIATVTGAPAAPDNSKGGTQGA